MSQGDFGRVIKKIEAVRSRTTDTTVVADMAVAIIYDSLPSYKWVGVYWLQGDHLVLGPYRGEATEHTRIAIGQGVCGTAIATGENQIVQDVRELGNYLACSLKTRSEIVVLIRDPSSGEVKGQIDVDGDEVSAFNEDDEQFLEKVAGLLVA